MNDELTFEDALSRLDAVVRDLEDGSLPLEQSLARYEEGVGLLKTCYARLRNAEQRIQQLTGVDENGQPLLTPFEHESSETPVARRTRKKEERS